MSVATHLEPVIGLEVHAQLLTASKMFCSCSADYANSPPNSHVCPVCLGLPGAMPVINRRAVDLTIMTGLALHCRIPERTKFDRKNYSYPDLPKGYQISQYDLPLAVDGRLSFRVGDRTQTCGIVRVHLEEDTGKSFHEKVDGRDASLIDYNRSGVPLMEIVSRPELSSPEAARDFFATLRQILMYIGANDGNLQEGSMRADVNVSLRLPSGNLGTKVEIKNLNSFRSVQRALEYEIERQSQVLANGGTVVQETRGWSEDTFTTVPQRTKEYAEDYRYFPEPDLPPLAITVRRQEELAAALPELPDARRRRFEQELGLSPMIAEVLTSERERADFFDATLAASGPVAPATVANWVANEFLALLTESGRAATASHVTPSKLARLVQLVESKSVSATAGKQVLAQMFASGEEAETIVARENLAQVSDADALAELVETALAENPDLVDSFRAGKTKVIERLLGAVMKASKGKANPAVVRNLLESRLQEP